jgi:arabinan endo-1,5-alpha-L-arabinosidase
VHRELDERGLNFVAGTKYESEELMSSPYRFRRKGYEDLVDGAWVSYRKGFYYLFYSGDECCSAEAHYAVSVARSKNPLGPYEKKGVILKGNSLWLGTGHNSIITDDQGQDWIVYHAIPGNQKILHVNEKETEVNRQMLLDKIIYGRDGWPKVQGEK